MGKRTGKRGEWYESMVRGFLRAIGIRGLFARGLLASQEQEQEQAYPASTPASSSRSDSALAGASVHSSLSHLSSNSSALPHSPNRPSASSAVRTCSPPGSSRVALERLRSTTSRRRTSLTGLTRLIDGVRRGLRRGALESLRVSAYENRSRPSRS